MADANWLPRIAKLMCNGCGDCITLCPTGALGWEDGKASLLQPTVCIYCATCEAVCPVSAIELPYRVILADSAVATSQEVS